MKQIFINLPVKDLEASKDFYTSLGFTPHPVFTFDDQQCLVWGEQVYVMLQNYAMFRSGNTKEMADSNQYSIATFTLPVESLDKMNELVERALKAGGKETSPMKDVGFMQIRNMEDPDGHHWAVIYLDMEKFNNR